jgi:hypothetical protein
MDQSHQKNFWIGLDENSENLNIMKKNEIIFGLLIVILYLFFGQRYFVVLPDTKKCVRNEVKTVFYLLDIGDSKIEIRQKIASLDLAYLQFKDSNIISAVTSPFEFGATNWIIHLYLVDDKLSGLIIRTLDSVAYHPKSAPVDRGKILEEWKNIEIIEVD